MKLVFTLTALVLSATLFSQKVFLKDSTSSCRANWKKGDQKVLYIAHNKESFENGKVTSASSFSYEAHVTVLDQYPAGYALQWTFQLPQIFKQANPYIADSLPVFNGMKMLYTTDETGGFMELLNWEEVRNTYVAMMELSLPKKPDGSPDPSLEKAKAMFHSRQMVESALIREIQLYHTPYGNSYSTRGTQAHTQIPTALSEEPLPAIHTSRITELRPKEDYFKLLVTQEIDRIGAAKLFEDLFKKMGLAPDSTLAEAKKILAEFSISDTSEYRVVASSGWITRIRYTRSGKSAQMGQTDSFIIEMKE